MLENLPITILDIIALVIIVVSAILATARGFVHEVLSIGAWVGAFLVTFFGFEHFQPYAQQLTDITLLADAGTALVLFLVTLVVLSLLSSNIAKNVKDSALGALDRALGFLFGALRGVIILCIIFLVTSFLLTEENMPNIAKESRGYPYVREITHSIMNYAPDSIKQRFFSTADEFREVMEDAQKANELKERLNNPLPSGKNQSQENQDQSGYSQKDREKLDSIFSQSE